MRLSGRFQAQQHPASWTLQTPRSPHDRNQLLLLAQLIPGGVVMPTGLTDEQMTTLMEAAAPLWPQRRALFLRSVFNRLADLPHPSDQQLQEAIDFVLAKIICACKK